LTPGPSGRLSGESGPSPAGGPDASLLEVIEELRARIDAQGRLLDAIARHVGLDPSGLSGSGLTAGVPPTSLIAPDAGDAPDLVPVQKADELWQRLGLTEGERRNVTVLFADVSGFTALSERLDDEDFQLVMRDTMAAIVSVIAREDGYVEKFIGDAVCAIFGAPTAHDDEPQRAARSALEINRVLAERAAQRPDLPPLGVHAGINTGIVIAGTVGDGSQFGVVGDTINTAARLMGLAQEGEIFVSAETARRLRRGFELEDRGLFPVKGKEHPVAAFNLVAQLAPGDLRSQGSLRAPFVGRDDELQALRALVARSRAGDGVAVVVVGEPGIGKTRLLDELVEAEGEGHVLIRASARVVGELPLGLITEAFGPHIAELPDGPDKDVISVVLNGSQALPPDFELTVARVLREVASVQPLLIVLEDVDSADRGSLELARYLSRETTDVPVLWVLAARAAPALFDAAVDGDPELQTIHLRPLAPAATASLMDGLLPGALSAVQLARLAHRADGNPEFAEEIALALIDEDIVAEVGDGTWRLTGDPDTVHIPSSVAELIEARIDRVSANARIALQDASVIGVRFRERLLHEVATVPDALASSLAELETAELVVGPDDDDPDAMWSFRSHVVREVAYDSILRRRKPAMHRAVAEALTRLEPGRVEDNVELLASHFELSDEPALAVPHLRLAVERAEASHSVTGAVDRARRALAIRDEHPNGVDDETASWFLEHLGVARMMLGDRGGLDDVKRAVELVRSAADVADEARLEERVGWFLTIAGDPVNAGHHLVRAQELAGGEGIDPQVAMAVRAAVAVSRAFSAGAAGRLTVAFDTVDGAVAEARAAGDPETEARALLVHGVLWLWEGKVGDARIALRHALDLAWDHQLAFLADRCGRWLVMAEVEAGDYREALELAAPLLARADERGDPSVAVGVRAALAELWREIGERERARELAEDAVALSSERSVAIDAAAEAHLVLAHAAIDTVALGEAPPASVGPALEALASLLAADPWLGWRLEARLELARGRAALVAGDPAGAREHAIAGRLRLDRAGAIRERLVADRIEGEALVGLGDVGGFAHLEQALVQAEEFGSPYLIGEAAAAVVRAAGPVPPEQAAAAMARATSARAALPTSDSLADVVH
jgi:class 3 adenylate cyclase/tetratricopeptide (TPR) repeat protein